ncbi:MAG: DinB family protein [Gemmatimonadetes bacterium]|nr:DinB family protein [Gemmatimonadota bacterium]
MKKATTLVLLSLALPMAASGQEAVIQSLKGLHDITEQNIMATAEMVSEELYAFQPTEEVRTMGGILAHIANAQYAFCSAAAGEESPNSANLEETLTMKADIVAGLQEAFAYCQGVYSAMTDAQGAEMRSFFGNQMAASGVLAFNSAHNYEHYGNLVTYMRINGITPPSSM